MNFFDLWTIWKQWNNSYADRQFDHLLKMDQFDVRSVILQNKSLKIGLFTGSKVPAKKISVLPIISFAFDIKNAKSMTGLPEIRARINGSKAFCTTF